MWSVRHSLEGIPLQTQPPIPDQAAAVNHPNISAPVSPLRAQSHSHNMPPPVSAATQVLNTNELVESILSYLPPESITFLMARITRSFQSNLLTRPQFLQALFLLPDFSVSPPRALHIALPGVVIRHSLLGERISLTIGRVAVGRLVDDEGLRRLLIRQPPLSVELLETAKVFHDLGCAYAHTMGWGLGDTDGLGELVRIGHVVDVASWMWKSGCGCGSVCVVLRVV